MTWFVSAGGRSRAPVQLFCLPYAGGGASAFRLWQAQFGADIEVLAVQLPGRENRIAEDPRFTVAEVATAISERADRPYAIYGHSMGARVGFEVVRELRHRGAPLPSRLYVGGARAPHITDSGLFHGLSEVDDAELLRRLSEGGGLPAAVLANAELTELLLPLLRADFERVDGYVYRLGEPLPVPVVAFSGIDDQAVTRAHSEAWARHTSAGFTLHDLPGGHFFLHDALPQLAAVIRDDLRVPGVPAAQGVAPHTAPARLRHTPAPAALPGADVGGARLRHTPAPAALPGADVGGARLRHTPAPAALPGAHRIPLGDTGWSVWRDAILRTTGFPADGLIHLSAPRAAAAADELLKDGGDAELFDKELAEAVKEGARRITALAGDPLLREAIAWQNPNALLALDGLVHGGADAPRNVRRRDRERALLMYWQRYCGKNETVGFFGPGCWVQLDPESSSAVRATPGPALTRRRWVVFESWALVAYADALARDPAIRRWWVPRLWPHLRLAGRGVLRPGRPPLPLSAVEAALVAACDGRRPAIDVVGDPATGLRRPEDGYALLERLVERELVTWDAALPATPAAESVLRERIAAIRDTAAQALARTGLDRLCAARDAVAATSGDPDALRAALAALDEVFTELTGAPPRRRDGQMYAGRTLCYLDANRDLDVVFGAPLLDTIAAPLGVLLQAARWMVTALQDAYGAVFRQLYDELRADADGGEVALSDLWILAQGSLFGTGKRPVDAVAAEFARRWAGLFGLEAAPRGTTGIQLSVADIAERVAEVFAAAHRPDWPNAGLHSPDLQICATDEDALARGDYTVVLGELHAAWASFDCEVFLPGHPDRERLRTALAEDLGTRRIRLLAPSDWPRRTSRVAEGLAGPTDRQLAFLPAPGGDPDRVLSTVDLRVREVDGELYATSRDGQRWRVIDVFSGLLSAHAVDGFKLVAAAPYTPRITLDRLVVARQTWRTTVGETGLAKVTGERERFLAVRRWRMRLGLPEQVYVKVSTETKPCYFDLSSPHYASMLCSTLRSAHMHGGDEVSVVVSEMLPTPEAAWVPDAQGRRYFSELRLHVVDAPADQGAVR